MNSQLSICKTCGLNAKCCKTDSPILFDFEKSLFEIEFKNFIRKEVSFSIIKKQKNTTDF